MGPAVYVRKEEPPPGKGQLGLTGDYHHLAPMAVVKALFALAGKYVGCDMCNVLVDMQVSYAEFKQTCYKTWILQLLTPRATGANL